MKVLITQPLLATRGGAAYESLKLQRDVRAFVCNHRSAILATGVAK